MPSAMNESVASARLNADMMNVRVSKPRSASSYSSLMRSASCWESGSSSRSMWPSSLGSAAAPQIEPVSALRLIWLGIRAFARTSVVPVASTSAAPMKALASLAWPMNVTAPPAPTWPAPLALPDALIWWLSSASALTSMSPGFAVTSAPLPIDASAMFTLLAMTDATPTWTVPPEPEVWTLSLAIVAFAAPAAAFVR